MRYPLQLALITNKCLFSLLLFKLGHRLNQFLHFSEIAIARCKDSIICFNSGLTQTGSEIHYQGFWVNTYLMFY
jgi:hypothetical protein